MAPRTIIQFEITSADREQSTKFFQEVFGWESHDYPDFQYTTLTTGNIDGGLTGVDGNDYQAGDVTVYVQSDDLEADLQHIESAGGKRVGEITEVPGFGSFAFFTDPVGNRLALWKNAE